ncbi:response regulator [Pyxidicoccus trucidator]|uniref:response regulator n=1 Tax=Pyxidicoccus trucidator TaxID=2709662 RepID=UPI0013DBC99E|nr:response regulator [Pyxidicoccus trucidator]
MHTVLLVDDDPSQLFIYTQVLELMGCAVATASDGLEALKMTPHLRPHLIITDVSMPRMGGLELCQRLAEDPWLRDTPVILHSGMDGVVAPEGAVFLAKLGDLEEFEAQVLRSLARARPARRLTPAA